MNLVQATLQSDNTVYAQLDLDVGPDAVQGRPYDMGITTKLNGYPAEGLGGLTIGVSPLEMANAYATIANGGYRNRPTAIRKVVFPDGKSKDLGQGAPQEGLHRRRHLPRRPRSSSRTSRAAPARGANIGCPAAGKTGTTDNYTDAWFVGFTPKLSTASWVGYPNHADPDATDVHGDHRCAGGTYPGRDLARLHVKVAVSARTAPTSRTPAVLAQRRPAPRRARVRSTVRLRRWRRRRHLEGPRERERRR